MQCDGSGLNTGGRSGLCGPEGPQHYGVLTAALLFTFKVES